MGLYCGPTSEMYNILSKHEEVQLLRSAIDDCDEISRLAEWWRFRVHGKNNKLRESCQKLLREMEEELVKEECGYCDDNKELPFGIVAVWK